MKNHPKILLIFAALAIIVTVAYELLYNTFSRKDSLISREGARILSDPDDKKALDKAIQKATKNKEETTEKQKITFTLPSSKEEISIFI